MTDNVHHIDPDRERLSTEFDALVATSVALAIVSVNADGSVTHLLGSENAAALIGALEVAKQELIAQNFGGEG